MDAVDVPFLNDESLYRINNCVAQWVDQNRPDVDDFFVICVWFPEPAKRILHHDCPDNGYTIIMKEQHQYQYADIIEKALSIWNSGYVPVEVIQSEGALFYGIDKLTIKHRTVRGNVMKLFEDH